jgi:hypothetical protein
MKMLTGIDDEILIHLYFFFQGETFEWPEKVPFRLTHNLVHAMVSKMGFFLIIL